MVRFAHLADSHLGGWRQPELQALNFLTFQKIIDIIIAEKLDFVLMCGDLFDSAYPSIEILKETFAEFKRLSDADIPVYLIAGSHDYSASGKTFLDVLEKAGFCRNIENSQVQDDGSIKLKPFIHEGIAIYGYPGKKSGMEIDELKKVYFDSVYPFTIFMLHTTINEAAVSPIMPSIDKLQLPLANYYALGHIHQNMHIEDGRQHYVYPGPTYPNNFQELVDLRMGSFQLTEITDKIKTRSVQIPIKEVVYIEKEINNGLTATEDIIHELDRYNLNDKILLLKLKGVLSAGKSGDIKFNEIEEFVKRKQAYCFLRNISSLVIKESDVSFSPGIEDVANVENEILEKWKEEHPDEFNRFLPQLMNLFSMEQKEDEKNQTFEDRLIDELKTALDIGGKL
jgi:hypothetical protein